MPSVYCHPRVRSVERLHREWLDRYPGEFSVLDVLSEQAEVLYRAHARGEMAVCVQLSNWLPRCIGRSEEEIMQMPLSLDEARETVACEHGFSGWGKAVRLGNRPLEPAFEAAVSAVISGDVDRLERLVDVNPHLPTDRSAYGHGATLLHYISANAVETWRQCVPLNAALVLKRLLECGADPGALMQVYGGDFAALALIESSAHTRAAGVVDQLVAVLKA